MIRDPIWGLKLTGREGANTIGVYVMRDNLTNLIFPGSQSSGATSLAMESTAVALRYKRDIGSNYSIGALFTDREGDDYFNQVFSLDGDFRLTRKDRLQVQLLGSSTRYPDQVAADFGQPQGSFSDRTIDITYMHSTRNWYVFAGYLDKGPGFRTDIGFTPRVDYRVHYASGRYSWIGKSGDWWRRFSVGGIYD